MMATTAPALQPFDDSAIPQALREARQWSPWVAAWDPERSKYSKRPARGLSTAAPKLWFTFAEALAAYERDKPAVAGIGYLLNPPHGIVAIDLDKCVHDGVLDAWAVEVVGLLNSYTEISPSGRGLRIMCAGAVAVDWTNHERGIEVYGGNKARFVTITGQHLPGTPADVRETGVEVFEGMCARYRPSIDDADAVVDLTVPMPELLDDILLPSPASLDLPYNVRDFLERGETRGVDRSRELRAAAVALFLCDLPDDEVFSLLATNPYAMEVAMDHRRQDPDRALFYLWKEHGIKAKAKAEAIRARKVAAADDFEDVSGAPAVAAVLAAKPMRFPVLSIPQLMQRPRATWLIRNFLPKAGMAMVYGESGSGKSYAVLDIVASVARGMDWRGHKVERSEPVVYICAEGEADFRDRVQAYCDFNGLQDFPLGIVADSPNFLERKDVADLVTSVRAFGPTSLIVIDTLAQVTPGANENSGEDMGRALAHCKALHRATGAMVLLVHHSGKDSSKGARGWSGLRAAVDAEFEVERAGEQFDAPRSIRVRKLKGGRDGAEFGFKLNLVEIGQHEDGETISSCVVVYGEVERKKAGPKGDKQQLVLRVTKDLLGLGENVTPNEVWEHAVNQLVRDESKRDTRRQVVAQAFDSLVSSGHIVLVGGFVRTA